MRFSSDTCKPFVLSHTVMRYRGKIHADPYFHTRQRPFVLLHTFFRTFTHVSLRILFSDQLLTGRFFCLTLYLTHT